MDIPSMIMGAAIASVAWTALVPWSRLRTRVARGEAEEWRAPD